MFLNLTGKIVDGVLTQLQLQLSEIPHVDFSLQHLFI